ncbi:MAG: hypothetical protein HC915_05300 [Anaerolineae bacterium]|nr:hypothetical protein [Anaerolineae bacterium]
MPFYLDVEAHPAVINLTLVGAVSLEDFRQIDAEVSAYLDEQAPEMRFALLVDVHETSTLPRDYRQLRGTQTYINRLELRYIAVIGSNKFMRFMMLLIFSLGRATLTFYDTPEQAWQYLHQVQLLSEARTG